MLLSPAALSSPWVLIEIGGAKALGLRLVPILFHIGANELPGPLGQNLGRDLNDIDLYYDEVRKRLKTGKAKKPTPPRVRKRPAAPVLKVGDRVKITINEAEADRTRPDLGWNEDMDPYVGAITTVTEVYQDRSVRVAVDDGAWYWALEWLVPFRSEA